MKKQFCSGLRVAAMAVVAGVAAVQAGADTVNHFPTIAAQGEADLDKLERLSALVGELGTGNEACAKVVKEIHQVKEGKIKALTKTQVEECGFKEGDLGIGSVQMVLNRIGNNNTKIVSLIAQMSRIGGDGTTNPVPPADKTTLRLMEVKAGDITTRHFCTGEAALNHMIFACFGQTGGETNGSTNVAKLAPSPQTSCTVADLTVETVCGYSPAPQGKNEIHIHYRCGDSQLQLEYTTRSGAGVNLLCDDGAYSAAPGN